MANSNKKPNWKRTGVIQTEKTATGIITTAQEKDQNSNRRRFVQIGYTSVEMVQNPDTGKWYEKTLGLTGNALNKHMIHCSNVGYV